MPLTEEQEDILKQFPQEMWSAYKTYVGRTKSVQPLQIKVKPESHLPLQRQYLLKQLASEGIKSTTE